MTISISSRPSSAFARWSRSFSQSSFRPIARTELTTFDSSTKTSTLRVRIGLACIGHKSLEFCDRCRLWQRNSPATPEYSAAFWRGEFKNSLFRFLYFKTGPAPYPFAPWQCTRLESARIWCWARVKSIYAPVSCGKSSNLNLSRFDGCRSSSFRHRYRGDQGCLRSAQAADESGRL